MIKHPTSMYSSRIELLKSVMKAFSDREINDIDGIKVQLDDESNTWSLMRFSTTEPLFRIYTGGKDKEIVESEHIKAVGVVKKILGCMESKGGITNRKE